MPASVARAARALSAGHLVVYPTDTLWGIAARATDRRAVDRLLRAKGRDPGAPISVAVSSTEEIEPWAELTPEARAWIRRHLPGPYTALVRPSARARARLPPAILPPGGALGVRVPDHAVGRRLAQLGGPITATSANRHGEAPARSLAAARAVFGAEVAVYLAGARPRGVPSRLVDLTGPQPRDRPRK